MKVTLTTESALNYLNELLTGEDSDIDLMFFPFLHSYAEMQLKDTQNKITLTLRENGTWVLEQEL